MFRCVCIWCVFCGSGFAACVLFGPLLGMSKLAGMTPINKILYGFLSMASFKGNPGFTPTTLGHSLSTSKKRGSKTETALSWANPIIVGREASKARRCGSGLGRMLVTWDKSQGCDVCSMFGVQSVFRLFSMAILPLFRVGFVSGSSFLPDRESATQYHKREPA